MLFLHGLESGPRGDKVQRLRAAGVDVLAEDMFMSIRRLDRRNSAVRNLLRLPEVRAIGALTVAAGAHAAVRRQPLFAAGTLVGLAVWAAARRGALQREALRRSWEACIAIQRAAIERHRPDVLLGSSWGGAVAVALIARGHWRGPTVLLAPAFQVVADRMATSDVARDVATLQTTAADHPIVVFHDPTDATIPIAHSEALAAGSAVELHRVAAGGHRLMGILDDGSLIAALDQVAAARAPLR